MTGSFMSAILTESVAGTVHPCPPAIHRAPGPLAVWPSPAVVAAMRDRLSPRRCPGHGTATARRRADPLGGHAPVDPEHQPTGRPFTDCSALFRLDALGFPAGRKGSTLRSRAPRSRCRSTTRTRAARPSRLSSSRSTTRDNETGNALRGQPRRTRAAPDRASPRPGRPRVGQAAVPLRPGRFRSARRRAVQPGHVHHRQRRRTSSTPRRRRAHRGRLRGGQAAGQGVASGCNAKYGAALADYNTVQTAKDMDRVREAVGEQPAELPRLLVRHRTRRGLRPPVPRPRRVAVLDGAVDPLTDGVTALGRPDDGLRGRLRPVRRRLPHACAVPVARRSTTGRLRPRHARQQDPVRRAATRESADGDRRDRAHRRALRAVLPVQLAGTRPGPHRRQGGDAQGCSRWPTQYNEREADGHYTNITDANTTITCNDAKPGPTDATIQATATRGPRSTRCSAYGPPRALFRARTGSPSAPRSATQTAATAAQVLVVGNLHDPATPYQGAKDLAKTMGNAALLTWDGEGHTSYLQGSSCVDDYVDDYLIVRHGAATEDDLPSMSPQPALTRAPARRPGPRRGARAARRAFARHRAGPPGQLAVLRMVPVRS